MSTRDTFQGFDDDISWLINDAPAELGMKGVTTELGPTGTHSCDPFPHHQRRRNAVHAVERWRRLMGYWSAIQHKHQVTLAAAYTARRYYAILGAEGTFGNMAGVALATAPDVQALIEALSNLSRKGNGAIVRAARRRAGKALREAHRAWSKARYDAQLALLGRAPSQPPPALEAGASP